MKLGLTTTSRSIPPLPLSIASEADKARAARVAREAIVASMKTPLETATKTPLEMGTPAATATPTPTPTPATEAEKRENAPASAVRHATSDLRSTHSMRAKAPPSPPDGSATASTSTHSARGNAPLSPPHGGAAASTSTHSARGKASLSSPRDSATASTSTQSMRGKVPSAPPRGSAAASASASALRKPKKERNAVETKRRILEAATAEFAAKGFDGARLGSIARAASVQQALIHHYFADKGGLHAEVVQGGLAMMTEGAWQLLSQMDAPVADRKGKKRRGPEELRALTEAFIDLLLRFFVTNGEFLAILRHEARRDSDGQMGTKIVADNVAPVFDAVVARLDEMRARGEVRKDVDARHLVLSCVAMIAFPFQEEPFVASIWPVDWRKPEHLAERKRDVVAMILARVLP